MTIRRNDLGTGITRIASRIVSEYPGYTSIACIPRVCLSAPIMMESKTTCAAEQQEVLGNTIHTASPRVYNSSSVEYHGALSRIPGALYRTTYMWSYRSGYFKLNFNVKSSRQQVRSATCQVRQPRYHVQQMELWQRCPAECGVTRATIHQVASTSLVGARVSWERVFNSWHRWHGSMDHVNNFKIPKSLRSASY